ncbi:hypothetical protein Mapa_007693 [Marchantia paleacea]|nr:hypothetical protein Mapa_007693 [Marchantia paleacea]
MSNPRSQIHGHSPLPLPPFPPACAVFLVGLEASIQETGHGRAAPIQEQPHPPPSSSSMSLSIPHCSGGRLGRWGSELAGVGRGKSWIFFCRKELSKMDRLID